MRPGKGSGALLSLGGMGRKPPLWWKASSSHSISTVRRWLVPVPATATVRAAAKAVLGKGHDTAPSAAAPTVAPATVAIGMTEEKIALLQKFTALQKSGVLTGGGFAAEEANLLRG